MAGADQVDKHLLSALRKQRAGGDDLTQREEIALNRHEKAQREKFGPGYVRACPKNHVLEAIGASSKVANDYVDRFDLPWETHSKTVNLFAVTKRLWSLLTKHSTALAKAERWEKRRDSAKEFFPDVAATDWQEECYKEKAFELRDKRLVREGSLIDAHAFESIAFPAADSFRDFVERLGKRYGPDAQKMALAWWRDWEDSVNHVLNDDHG